ncbi:uncharacterized protein LOC105309953 [Pteropus vampyrus]|uniref:Uncharacterized protein LOC105309953 n=1 Tax=Pteropus vampyrus TaxID=132908 RepID=A0A6P6C504_PTEVA|nr:uncharacterized protein LOC105309953 [Pteropus vampyrus]
MVTVRKPARSVTAQQSGVRLCVRDAEGASAGGVRNSSDDRRKREFVTGPPGPSVWWRPAVSRPKVVVTACRTETRSAPANAEAYPRSPEGAAYGDRHQDVHGGDPSFGSAAASGVRGPVRAVTVGRSRERSQVRSLRPRRVSVELPWERDRRCTGHGPRAVPCWEPTRSDLWRHTAPVLGSRDGAPQQTAPHRAPGCPGGTAVIGVSPGGRDSLGMSPGGRDSLGMEQGTGSGKTGSADGDGAGARVSSETRPQPEGIQKASYHSPLKYCAPLVICHHEKIGGDAGHVCGAPFSRSQR